MGVKVAVIGSRGLMVDDLGRYLPEDTEELISGGARGVDACARGYALAHGVPLREFLPDYARYGRLAPLIRNVEIVQSSDLVLAFWDGRSRGTVHVVKQCRERGVPCRIFLYRRA